MDDESTLTNQPMTPDLSAAGEPRAKPDSADSPGALIQLRAYLAQQELPENTRLPPERELGKLLGLARGDLRKAMAVLESEGEIWRHVGKGTFIGSRPKDELFSISTIASQSSPAEVLRTRLLIEPVIAREAALNATADNIREMRRCLRRTRQARSWRQYEHWTNTLHRTIAQSTRNTLLLAMFDTMITVRRAVFWGRLRPTKDKPSRDHRSFAEHGAIIDAIEQRDPRGAAQHMRDHLGMVHERLLDTALDES